MISLSSKSLFLHRAPFYGLFLALLKARSEASKFDFQRIGIEYRDVLHCMLGTMYVCVLTLFRKKKFILDEIV